MKKTILVPRLNSNDDLMQVSKWLVNNKEFIKEGDNLVQFETSKTVIDVQCENAGYLLRHCEAGDNVAVGTSLASIYSNLLELENDLKENMASMKNPTKTDQDNLDSKFTEAAQEYINKHGIDPKQFEDFKLVTVKIIQETLAKNEQLEPSAISEGSPIVNKPAVQEDKMTFKKMKVEEINNAKRLEINFLSEGQSGGLNSSLSVQFKSEQIRSYLKQALGMDNQIFPYFLCVLADTLLEYPKFTAYFNAGRIHYYNEINLGIAFDLGKGLKVPVIKNANVATLTDIQACIKNYVIGYYDDSIHVDDLSGSTITITDLSNDNILYFQPLINKRQSVVLGIGGDKVMENYPMTLTLVFDHRVLTGREVSSFLNTLKFRLLDPATELRRIKR